MNTKEIEQLAIEIADTMIGKMLEGGEGTPIQDAWLYWDEEYREAERIDLIDFVYCILSEYNIIEK